MKNGIETIGNWKKQIEDPMEGAIQTTIAVSGRTFEDACKRAIILMAQSARALTPKVRKSRKLQTEGRGKGKRTYLWKYTKIGKKKWYLPNRQWHPDEYERVKEKLKPIPHRGLAKRSWMWGLRDLNSSKVKSKPMTGVGSVRAFRKQDEGGYILINRLSYILKIMPIGWKQTAAQKASARIMHQAKRKLENKWKSEMRRKQKKQIKTMVNIGQYFLKG